jgi:CRP/FNR family cyclic AMP-dependent transcriptional regulator
VTLEESLLLWMNREHFKQAIETIPRFALNLLGILTRRLRLSTEHIQTLAALDVNGRIARQLLAFADHYGRKSPSGEVTIPICLTQSEIAELVGASRKRVNQIIVAFKRYGWISIDNEYHITILNNAALAHMSARG